jgi:hypothetical protein
MTQERKANLFLLSFFLVIISAALLLPAYPQDPGYHNLAVDHRHFGIPSFFNVVSNVPFLIVGVMGWTNRTRVSPATAAIFRAGVFATGLGSAYYHFGPTNQTLFWDRLPMAIAFSAVASALVQQRLSAPVGRLMLLPLTILSSLTVVYWIWTENKGHGNLIPYAAVQFGSLLLVVLTLVLFPRKDFSQRNLWLAIAAYTVAKLLEAFDVHVANIIHVMGGHPIKHVAAALGCWFVSRALFEEQPAR